LAVQPGFHGEHDGVTEFVRYLIIADVLRKLSVRSG